MSFVLDASIAAAWAFVDETTEYSEAVQMRLETDIAVVPHLWFSEVANVILSAERRGRLDEARTAQFLFLLRELPVEVAQAGSRDQMSRLVHLGRTYHLTSYDATYLDLAMQEGLPLATLDNALRTAAAHSGVRLV